MFACTRIRLVGLGAERVEEGAESLKAVALCGRGGGDGEERKVDPL